MSKETEFDYTYANESFSGCDMVATLLVPMKNGEKKAYVIGEIQTLSYSTHMDRRPVRSIGNINAKEYLMGQRTIGGSLVMAVFSRHFAKKIMADIQKENGIKYAFLADELPPFDIIITMANEYGVRSKLVIYGVRLVNEGQVMSVNDVYTENTYQYVAMDLEYLNNENEYINNSYRGIRGSRYIIKEKDMDEINYNPPKVKEDIPDILVCPTEIRARTLSMATEKLKGEVELFTFPKKTYGEIEIVSLNDNNIKYNIPLNEKNNGKVFIQLYGGRYRAQWRSGSDKSNEIEIFVDYEYVNNTISLQAPIVDYVTDTRIDITVPNMQNTKLIYEDYNNKKFILQLSGHNATMHDLIPGSIYKIYSCNEDMKNISPSIEVKTLNYGHNRYSDFTEYLLYNKKVLKYDDFNLYMKVVNDSEDILYKNNSIKNNKYKTISDTIAIAYKKYIDELGKIKTTDFTNINDYNNAINKMNALINISRELLYISNNINNDSIYGYNYKTKVVNPPILQYKNNCTNTFFIDDSIAKISFYKKFGDTVQHDKTIYKRSFIKIEDNIACIYTGRPDTNCYCIAYNDNGFMSPKLDFYIQGNNYRARQLESTIDDNINTNLEVDRMNLKIKNSYSDLSNEDTKNVSIENIKDNIVRMVCAPVVVYRNEKSITLKIIDNTTYLINNNCYVVASAVNDALKECTKYKKKINELVTFTMSKDGLKNNTNYLFWIEDENGNQISTTTSAFTEIETYDNTISKYNMDKYFIDKYTKILIDNMKKNRCYDSNLNNIISNDINSYDSNKSNIMPKIMKDIMKNSNLLSNISEIINSYYDTWFSMNYLIKEDFFDIPISIKNNKILVSKNCIANIYKLSKNEISIDNKMYSMNSEIDLSEIKSEYIIINFTDSEMNSSGFILIDKNHNKIIGNKIKVEGDL